MFTSSDPWNALTPMYAVLAKATHDGTEYAIANAMDAMRITDIDPAWDSVGWYASYGDAFEACAAMQRDA